MFLRKAVNYLWPRYAVALEVLEWDIIHVRFGRYRPTLQTQTLSYCHRTPPGEGTILNPTYPLPHLTLLSHADLAWEGSFLESQGGRRCAYLPYSSAETITYTAGRPFGSIDQETRTRLQRTQAYTILHTLSCTQTDTHSTTWPTPHSQMRRRPRAAAGPPFSR